MFSPAKAKAQQTVKQKEGRIRYVVIGDSYSNGEGASPNESWPAVLTRHLAANGVPVFRNAKPNFATLQIGVNDWVQGVDPETFRKNFTFLVDQMLGALPIKNRLLVVAIPDFGVTPPGPKYARGRDISEGIASFTKIVTHESNKRGLLVVDVFELSKKMGDDRSLVAADGLHPSAKEYAEWEKIIFRVALDLLKNER